MTPSKKKILFIDRDGTLIKEPFDHQVDSLEKLSLMPDVIPVLLALKKAGFVFVMVSNQDGLGTDSLPEKDFLIPHTFMLDLFKSQGIEFEAVRICPHHVSDNCACRKPKTALVHDYIIQQVMDIQHSYVIGDRETDRQLAENMGIQSMLISAENPENNQTAWQMIKNKILYTLRVSKIFRKTKETEITAEVNLDNDAVIAISTGLGFFDHMLEQLAKHGGFGLVLHAKGDLHIDEHHTVEDTGLVLGEAIHKALGDKLGLQRYGFLLPMDEATCQVALDLSGRPYFKAEVVFPRDRVGDFSTEMVLHFFRSFSEALKASLHIKAQGENTHHIIEALFKSVGRSLRMAIKQHGYDLPSTKGVL